MKQTIQVLNNMLKEGLLRDYAIGGAIAVFFYTEPQATMDIDIFVHFPESDALLLSLDPLKEYLTQRGHSMEGEHFSIHGALVQFLPTKGLTEDALNKAAKTSFYGEPSKVFTKEHLAAIMVSLRRPKDKARLPLLLELEDFDMQTFESILASFGLLDPWAKLKVLYG